MQETSSGKTLYAGLPGSTGRQLLAPERQFIFLFGRPDAGKSNFIESHPGNYILNLDLTSTSNPDPVAVTWPSLDPNSGQPLDSEGKAFELTWNHVIEIVEKLEQLATNNAPRPATVTIDSLTTALRLAKKWVPKGIGMGDANRNFNQMDGRMAYDFLYDHLIDVCMRLRKAGYGVILIGHVKTKKMYDTEGRLIREGEEGAFSDSFFQRLFPLVEMSCSIVRVEEEVAEKVNKVHKLKGREVVTPEIKYRKETKHILGFHGGDMVNYFKGRARPHIVLPAVGAWSVFCREYTDLLQSRLNSLQGDDSQ